MAVRCKVDGRVVAQAEQTFVFNAVPLDDPGESERLEAIERKALSELWPGCPPEDRA